MKVIKAVGKVIIAGTLSIVILSFLMSAYSLTPLHLINEKGNTDYVWEPDSVWTNMNEGISWGRHDAAGYNNAEVIENPDIIIVGSSHMEGRNVFQKQTVSSILNCKLAGRYTVYNMGISGHDFYKACQYLPEDCKIYKNNPKIIIIETTTINLTQDDVDKVLTKTVEFTTSNSDGVIAAIQRVPFFRQIYKQMTLGLIDLLFPPRNKEEVSACSELILEYDDSSIDINAYEDMFTYLSNIENTYGVQLVIFYHPTGYLYKDGSVVYRGGTALDAYKEYASTKGIDFIDMTETFKSMYVNEHHFAHGFITGKLEADHLNVYGHKAIADCLYDVILELDEEGALCK